MRPFIRSSFALATIASALVPAVATAPALAQSFSGVPLSPIVQGRGPFKQLVAGASVVRSNASVAPSVTATVDVPDGSLPAFGAVFWWGSTVDGQPDRTATLTLPDGTSLTLDASDPSPDDPDGSLQNPSDPDRLNDDDDPCFTISTEPDGQTGVLYFQCALDITEVLAQLPTLDGDYTFAGLNPNVAAPHKSPCPSGSEACSIYVGAFALAMFYADPNDLSARVVQLANGLVFTQQFGDNASGALLPFEMSNNGGQVTVVALEGDVEFPAAGTCNPALGAPALIDELDDTGLPACDILAFCRDTCITDLSIFQLTRGDVVATMANTTNPAGNVFNETVSTEFGAEVTGVTGDELNSLDIDTFNLQGRLPNGLYENLVVGIQSGGDAVLLPLVAVSIEDFDRDGDGLSNIQEEDEVFTNPNDPDTDGDGIPDGAEFFGGNPADPRSNPTNPLVADTDADGLCDGDGTDSATGVRVSGCALGEDVNNDGLLDPNETNPNNADTDGDLLADGLEVLQGNYGAEGAAGTVDADAGRAGRQTNPLDRDTDDDGLDDGVEDVNKDGAFNPNLNETDPTDADTDDGGESDGSERGNGRNPVDFPLDDNGNLGNDNDGDGLANGQEDANNNGVVDPGETDPNDADTDGDGLGDGVEVNGVNDTNPLDPDTDADGLCDGTGADLVTGTPTTGCSGGEDRNQNGSSEADETNPTDADTDGDGLDDGVEDADLDSDAADRGTNETDPTDADTDNDGLCDGPAAVSPTCIAGEDSDADAAAGDRGTTETDPLIPDTDGDGIKDGVEVSSNYPGPVDANPATPGSQTNPLDPDSDDDGIQDGVEDVNVDGSLQGGETDPTDPESPEPAEGEGEADPTGDRGDELDTEKAPPVPEEVEKFIAGSAAYTCANVGAAGAPMIGLLALLALGRRRSRR